MSKKPTFGIFSPSSYINTDRFGPGVEKLRALGHEVIIHPQAYNRFGETQMAGSTDEKIQALYDLMANPAVDIVMTSNGGQTSARMLDTLDFTRLTKPILGYSDGTSLVNAIYAQTGKIQFHGTDAQWYRPQLFRNDFYEHMLKVLAGTADHIPLDGSVTQTPGTGTGILVGGNLAVFQHLLYTKWCPKLDGAILFFEDIGVELTSIDRTLNYFRQLGLFDRAAGVMFGQFTNSMDTGRPFGFTIDQIIANHTARTTCPVVIHAPIGHNGLLSTLPLGGKATLSASMTGTPTLTLVK